MGNRKDLLDRQNQIRNAYNYTKVQMEKTGASPEQLGQLIESFKSKMNEAEMSFGDDLNSLNRGNSIAVKNGTTVGIDLAQEKLPDAAKQVNLGKQSMFKNIAGKLGKKAAGVIPLVGVASAALSGDPAMAADELVSDASDLAAPIAAKLGAGAAAGPIGMAAMAAQQALSPTESGNPEEERMMLAERDAMDSYNSSPAAQDAQKFRKIRGSLGNK